MFNSVFWQIEQKLNSAEYFLIWFQLKHFKTSAIGGGSGGLGDSQSHVTKVELECSGP